jgi:hypothetical protein
MRSSLHAAVAGLAAHDVGARPIVRPGSRRIR